MGTLLCLAQIVLCTTNDYVVTMFDKVLDAVLQRKQLRTACLVSMVVNQSNAVNGKGSLQSCHLEQFVQYDIGIEVAFYVNNNAHTVLITLIVYVRDTVNAFLSSQLTDKLHQLFLIQSVGKFRYDDGVVLRPRLNISLCTHDDATTPRLVSIAHTLHTHDVTTRREIRCFDILHQFTNCDVGIVDIGHTAVNHLTQVVGRHVCSHTYCNTAGTIHQEVRNACWHYAGFVTCIIEVAVHIDRFLLNVLHHSLANGWEARLSVTHSGSRVTIHWTEVTLTFNQRVTHIPGLGQTYQGTIYWAITVWVVLTEYVTHNAGWLTSGLVVRNAQLHHVEEDAAVNGLEAITHIGECARHNHRHRVVNIRRLHFFFYIDFNNSVVVCYHWF